MGHCDEEQMYSMLWKKERQTEWFIYCGQRHMLRNKRGEELTEVVGLIASPCHGHVLTWAAEAAHA